MVFHDQSQDITSQLLELSRSEAEIGLEDHCFHAGPLIRKEKGYEFTSRSFRGKIFARMMAFASHVDFRYHCLYVDKRYISTQKQIVDRLKNALVEFGNSSGSILKTADRIKIYYDCGQSPVTNMLHESFTQMQIQNAEFAQGVTPSRFRLFQLADLVCTVRLIELRLINGLQMTQSETRFFGGPRDFKRNVLKNLSARKYENRKNLALRSGSSVLLSACAEVDYFCLRRRARSEPSMRFRPHYNLTPVAKGVSQKLGKVVEIGFRNASQKYRYKESGVF